MTSSAVIRLSPALDASLRLQVLAVDFELRLYQDGAEVLGIRKGQPLVSHPLQRHSAYALRFNNNDGGPGLLHFQVLEARAQSLVRYEVNIGTISSPQVLDLQFSFRTDPTLPSPR